MAKKIKKKLSTQEIQESYEDRLEEYHLKQITNLCPHCKALLESISIYIGILYICTECDYRSFKRYQGEKHDK